MADEPMRPIVTSEALRRLRRRALLRPQRIWVRADVQDVAVIP